MLIVFLDTFTWIQKNTKWFCILQWLDYLKCELVVIILILFTSQWLQVTNARRQSFHLWLYFSSFLPFTWNKLTKVEFVLMARNIFVKDPKMYLKVKKSLISFSLPFCSLWFIFLPLIGWKVCQVTLIFAIFLFFLIFIDSLKYCMLMLGRKKNFQWNLFYL